MKYWQTWREGRRRREEKGGRGGRERGRVREEGGMGSRKEGPRAHGSIPPALLIPQPESLGSDKGQ